MGNVPRAYDDNNGILTIHRDQNQPETPSFQETIPIPHSGNSSSVPYSSNIPYQESPLINGAETNDVYNMSNGTYGSTQYVASQREPEVILSKSVEHIVSPSDTKMLKTGSYNEAFLNDFKRTTNSQASPTLFVLPGTSVQMVYNDGKSRTINNKSNKGNGGDVIMSDTFNVVSFSVSRVNPTYNYENNYENFDVSSRGISISWIDVLIIIILISIGYWICNVNCSTSPKQSS